MLDRTLRVTVWCLLVEELYFLLLTTLTISIIIHQLAEIRVLILLLSSWKSDMRAKVQIRWINFSYLALVLSLRIFFSNH